MRDIKEMAREVKMPYDFVTGEPINIEKLEAFANLVRADALAEQPAQTLPFGVGGGLVAIKTLLSRDPCVHAHTAIQMIDAILAEQPAYRAVKTFHEGKPVYVAEQPAQPTVPDALTAADKESPEYTQGWNDCRQAMLAS